jgi:hypothetical protein
MHVQGLHIIPFQLLWGMRGKLVRFTEMLFVGIDVCTR